MAREKGYNTRIAKELEGLRKNLADKNKTSRIDADREIVKVWNEFKISGIKGIKLRKEIIF